MPRHVGNVLAPLAQRRQHDGKNGDAIPQILAERPSATMAAKSRCVAATIRTSTLIGRCPPTRSSQPSCRIRSRRTWASSGNSPSSSSSSVPPSARSNQPLRVSMAPVNAPFSWPNNCESISS